MQFQLFTVPVIDDGQSLEEMNKFLRSHKILEVEQELVSAKNGSQWYFCVKYLGNSIAEKPLQHISKIDYKEVLDENTFATFSILREARKKIAEEDGLPVYAVFTNEFNRTSHGLPALGFIVYPNQTRLNKRSRNRYVSKFIHYSEELSQNKISEIEFSQRFLSLYSFINHANSKGFARNILQKYGTPLRAPTA